MQRAGSEITELSLWLCPPLILSVGRHTTLSQCDYACNQLILLIALTSGHMTEETKTRCWGFSVKDNCGKYCKDPSCRWSYAIAGGVHCYDD
jgi:hypothetical protein